MMEVMEVGEVNSEERLVCGCGLRELKVLGMLVDNPRKGKLAWLVVLGAMSEFSNGVAVWLMGPKANPLKRLSESLAHLSYGLTAVSARKEPGNRDGR